MTYWTLEYDSEEKSFADWGLSEGLTCQRGNMAADVVSVRVPGAMDGAALFDYGAAVIVRRDRVLGEGGYDGGTVFFQGKVCGTRRDGSGTAEEIIYEFAGPWWDFERLVFQQEWKECTHYSILGDPTSPPVYTTKRTSELLLGLDGDGDAQTTGAQISEALAWAVTCGVAVQAGTIDPATNIPWYHVRDVTVAEVIVQMLRWTPDCVVWFDYTTSPPTVHCRKLANLAEVTVAAADQNVAGVSLAPRHDLVLPAVCLRFKSVHTVDGVPWTTFANQNYPAEATGQELGASVHTIELTGYSQTNVYGDLVCAACGAQDGDNADRVAWWQTKEPLFNSLKVDQTTLAISSAVIVDGNGDAISLASYPNELLAGQVANWMVLGDETPVGVVEATVRALATYDLYREDEGWEEANAEKFLLQKQRTKELSVRIRLTNGVTGAYSAVSAASAAESAPAGLAQDIYTAHAVLQYEGQVSLVGVELPAAIGMGNRLKVNTGGAEYANLLVQQVSEDLGTGMLTLTVGPAKHLGLGDLIELLRVNRQRLTYVNPLTRSGGSAGGNTSVTLGKETPRENTTTGLGNEEARGVSAPGETGETVVVTQDAAAQELRLEVLDATGAPVEGKGLIRIALADLANATLGEGWTSIETFLRRIHYTDAQDGGKRRCYALASLPEDDETDDGHSDDVEDLYLGGGTGGGTVKRLKVTEVKSDYLVCESIPPAFTVTAAAPTADHHGSGYEVDDVLTVAGGTGTAATLRVATIGGGGSVESLVVVTAGDYTVLPATPNSVTGGSGTGAQADLTFSGYYNVAKPPELRHLASEVIEGTTVTYTYAVRTNNADGKRTAAAGSGTEQTEIVLPVWHVGASPDTIYSEILACEPVGGTGVEDDDEAVLTWQDLNVAGRGWCQVE